MNNATTESGFFHYTLDGTPVSRQKRTKPNVRSACVPCHKAHKGCDEMRPCQRCISREHPELCKDQPKKRKNSKKIEEDRTISKKQKIQKSNGFESSKWTFSFHQPLNHQSPDDTSLSIHPNLHIPTFIPSNITQPQQEKETLPSISSGFDKEPELELLYDLSFELENTIESLQSCMRELQAEVIENRKNQTQALKTLNNLQRQTLFLLHDPTNQPLNFPVSDQEPATSTWHITNLTLINFNSGFVNLVKISKIELQNGFKFQQLFPEFFLPFAHDLHQKLKKDLNLGIESCVVQVMIIQTGVGIEIPVHVKCYAVKDKNVKYFITEMRKWT